MKIGRLVTELSPVAESAVRLCSQAWEIFQQQARDDALVAHLIGGMGRMIALVAAVEDHARLLRLKSTIAEMLVLVEDTSRFVIEYKSDPSTFRTVVLGVTQNRVDGFVRRFKYLMKEFSSGMAAQLVQRVEKLISDSDWVLVDKLITPGACYDPSHCCLEGTRAQILDDIENWAHDTSGSTSLYWLHGPAGCGKSSVASSISERLDKTGVLAGSFFCKRDNEHLCKPENLISSLAASLAYKCEPYGLQLVEALRNDRQLVHSATRTRFAGLIANPMRAVNDDTAPNPLIVVVDALDENGTVDSRKELVQCLLRVTQTTRWLKVIMTSRPNDEIRHLLEENQGHILQCNLFTQNPSDLSQDILAYTRYRMVGISPKVGDRDHWPDGMEIEQLCAKSNNLFIWARTACNLIEQSLDPPTSLHQILAGVQHLGPKQALGDIYTTALDECLGRNIDDTETIRLCVGAIVLTGTRRPLSDTALAALLGERIKPHMVTSVVVRLGSVLYRDDKGTIRVLHHSFSDYMTDESCPERYRIDMAAQNAELAASCLELMMMNLRFNICGLEDSRMLNRDVPNLQNLVEKNISLELAYSSVYWTTHLSATTLPIVAQPYGNFLDRFMSGPHLMYWIEVLSLLGELHGAPSSMHQLASWINNPCSRYAICARDVYRFVSAAFIPISSSTPHLYVSAFPFGAANYPTLHKLKSWFPNTLIVSLGKTIWKFQPLCTIDRTGFVAAIAFSPDGRCIVSGSTDNILRVWDAQTGAAMLKPLLGHSDLVASIVFSPGGQYIISGSDDRTVRIWDARTGSSVLEPLFGHSDWVTSVASSPEGGRIVSGSRDGTARVWDIKTGETLLALPRSIYSVAAAIFSSDGQRVFTSYSNRMLRIWDAKTGAAVFEKRFDSPSMVRPIAFAPDARYFASGFADWTVRIWDTYTTAPVLEPLKGHFDFVTSVAFSPDGHTIASGCRDGIVRAWDAQTGKAVFRSLHGHSHFVTSISFSPDSKKVASSSYDDTIRIWDVQDDVSALKALQGPSNFVTSVAFCPSGQRVASGSWDHTVQIWDIQTSTAICDPLTGHTNVVTSVAFSPGGQRIVSGSADCTLRVWDAQTGALALDPLRGHAYHVTAVAFSYDGQRIASGSADRTIRVWNAQTGVAILELRGHANRVTSVAFSRDGQRIVSGSEDGTLRIWDAQTGTTLVGPCAVMLAM